MIQWIFVGIVKGILREACVFPLCYDKAFVYAGKFVEKLDGSDLEDISAQVVNSATGEYTITNETIDSWLEEHHGIPMARKRKQLPITKSKT